MGNTNTIPVVAQVKSAVQLVTGDVEGAARTQERFFHEAVGFSQVTAVAYAVTGNKKKAEETFDRGMSAVSSAVDGIPVVGHMKGFVHYSMGNDERGHRSVVSANRNAAVMTGGMAGFLAGGPVGAVAGGMATGSAFDVGHTVITDKPQGTVRTVGEFVENPSPAALFDVVAGPVSDALTGYQGGHIVESIQHFSPSKEASNPTVKAETALPKAEGKSEGGGYFEMAKAKFDAARDVYNEADRYRTVEKLTNPVDCIKTFTGGYTGNSKKEEQEKCQVSTSVSSSSSPTTNLISFISAGYNCSPTVVNECKLSKTEVMYYQGFQSLLEAYEKYNPLIDLSKHIIECKQILKGVGEPAVRTTMKFAKQIFDEKKQQIYGYGSDVVEGCEEENLMTGFQTFYRIQCETMGILNFLLSYPQECHTRLKDLNTSSFPDFYQEVFNKHKPLTECEKDLLLQNAIEYYVKNPSKRAKMLVNELRMIAYLRT